MSRDRGNLVQLGTFIRERRQALSLTQTQLGRRIGYYQERISALERGTYGLPSLPALEELAQALECELMDILCACGYVETRSFEPPVVTEVEVVTQSQLRGGVLQIQKGVGDLQERLSTTESAMYEMQAIRDRMRAAREDLDAGVRQCLEMFA